MPLGDIAGGIVDGLLRLLTRLFVDIVLEVLIRGAGYVICRRFSASVDPDGVAVLITGLLFWAAVGAGGYALLDFALR